MSYLLQFSLTLFRKSRRLKQVKGLANKWAHITVNSRREHCHARQHTAVLTVEKPQVVPPSYTNTHTHTVVPAHVFLLTVMHGYSVTLINNTGIADVLFWRDDCYPSGTNDTVVLYSPAVFEPRSDSY